MRIGLTYDLRDDYRALGFSEEAVAELDSLDTIDALDGALTRLGYATDRIGHLRTLAERLVRGERWDLVFNIAEGVRGRCREAQVPALLEAFDIAYVFSDPLTCAATLDKAVAKRLVQAAGVPTAPFAVLARDGDEAGVDLPFPLFVKPIAEGTGKGCEPASKVWSPDELRIAAQSIRARYDQPAIAEPFLPGRELTVGIVGNGADAEVIAVMEITVLNQGRGGVYSLGDKEDCESRVTYALVDDAEARVAGRFALDAYRTLECRDAARIDLRSDAAGRPQFLEVNPLAGLHPTHSDLPILAGLAGLDYDALIERIVGASLARTGLDAAARLRA
jgi:D-alanine-D-alanine ligase